MFQNNYTSIYSIICAFDSDTWSVSEGFLNQRTQEQKKRTLSTSQDSCDHGAGLTLLF